MRGMIGVLMAGIAVAQSGCAAAYVAALGHVAALEPTHTDVPIATTSVERASGNRGAGHVEQEATIVRVSVGRACDIVQQQTVDRTTVTKHVNEAKWLDGTLGVLAFGAIGSGAWIIADSANVYDSDKSSRTYNATGQNKALAYGVLTTGAGVALLAIPLANMIRAHRTTEQTQRVEVLGEIKKRDVICSGTPFANRSLRLRLDGEEFDLGTTDGDGTLSVNLDEIVPGTTSGDSLRGSASVLLHEQVIGKVDLSPLYAPREAAAWLGVNSVACERPLITESCASVSAYLRQFPQGEHAATASAIRERAEPELVRLRDEQAWASIDVDACARPTFTDPAEIAEACDPVRRYVTKFDTGRHLDESNAALAMADARITEIRTKRAHDRAEAETRRAAEARAQDATSCRADCIRKCTKALRQEQCLKTCLPACSPGGQ